jgi:cytochrome P450
MRSAALPPGPVGHHLAGNVLDYKRDPLGYLTCCSREYGDIVRLRFLGRLTYLLSSPDYIEYVLVNNNRNFTKSRARYLHRFRQEMMLIGNSLLASEGEFWRRQRRLSQPAFHRQRINAYGEVMVSCTERMLATWRDGETCDVHQEMMSLLLEIVARTLFDAGIAGKTGEVKEALRRISKTLGGQGGGIQLQEGYYGMLLQFLGYLRFLKALRQLDKITYSIINERRSSGENSDDLLSTLLHFQDEDGNRMSDRQLRDEVVAMFFAGYETTANSLSWTWYLLSQHPEVETKLLAELQEVLGNRVPTVEDLHRLQYTKMVVKESMRLYPPVWSIGREALKECEIGGYQVPAGTQLLLAQWVVHRDPRYFDDPEVFSPGRWEDESAKGIPKYAYFPFGGGPHLCIGSSFAMMEATLVLATIAKKFQLKLVSEQQAIPQPSITLHPTGGLNMLIKERSPKR